MDAILEAILIGTVTSPSCNPSSIAIAFPSYLPRDCDDLFFTLNLPFCIFCLNLVSVLGFLLTILPEVADLLLFRVFDGQHCYLLSCRYNDGVLLETWIMAFTLKTVLAIISVFCRYHCFSTIYTYSIYSSKN